MLQKAKDSKPDVFSHSIDNETKRNLILGLELKSLDINFDDFKREMMREHGTKNYRYYSIATNMLLQLKNEFHGIWHVSVGSYLDYFPASNSSYVTFMIGDIQFNVQELPEKSVSI
jgi:hypothetical protein